MGRIPKYTTAEHTFANEIFLQIENVDIITRRSSLYEVWVKFPPKKKGLFKLRIVHNLFSVSYYTIKSSYSIYNLDKTLNTAIWPGVRVYLMSDETNGYWTISIEVRDYNKTGFIISNR